ncbi:MAG: hypothetical protein HQ582_06725 [Planctomycetes bacterium]|nr:hypothetical protein [Planctomycetota bacterium]
MSTVRLEISDDRQIPIIRLDPSPLTLCARYTYEDSPPAEPPDIQKSMDQKLARILADSGCRGFILADAKDADVGFGISAPGKSPEHHAHEGKFHTLDEYRGLMSPADKAQWNMERWKRILG